MEQEDVVMKESKKTLFHVAHVRYVEGENHLRLQLTLNHDQKSFYRSIDEKLDKIRHRLQILALSSLEHDQQRLALHQKNPNACTNNKKIKKKKNSNRIPPDISVGQGGTQKTKAAIAPLVIFFTAQNEALKCAKYTIKDGLMLTERIQIGNDLVYIVLKNEPRVLSLNALSPVLANVPIIPLPECEFCLPEDCTWEWLRLRPSNDKDGYNEGEICCKSRSYTPKEEEIGCRFRITCQAPQSMVRRNDIVSIESHAEMISCPVVPGPNRQVFAPRRHVAKRRISQDTFRIMSYNILFDGYTMTHQAKTSLFPYANEKILQETYRMQLVFEEIQETNPHIICLQEMGQAIYHSFFEPILKVFHQYHGMYAPKAGTTLEGCAVFVDTNYFEVIEEKLLNLSILIQHSLDPVLQNFLKSFPEILQAIQRIPSIAQILVLKHLGGSNHHVIVANTHLFYREDAHIIRLLQTVIVVRELEKMVVDIGGHTGIVLCGDLNAFPSTIPVKFLLNARVDASNEQWKNAYQFQWAQQNDRCNGNSVEHGLGSQSSAMTDDSNNNGTGAYHLGKRRHSNLPEVISGNFEHHLNLMSACGIPEFTNFAGTFLGTLDYIMIGTRQLAVEQIFPMFTLEQVSREVALPSSDFPSDHVALICDVKWKPEQ
jgi:2',5'-phosphodiesterase